MDPMSSSHDISFATSPSSPIGHQTPALLTSSTSKDVSARILKKRESDRRCQRIKRERTKFKIAALEEKVRNFGCQDSTGQVQILMKQLQDVEMERDMLAKKVQTIETVIKDGGLDGSNHSRTNTTFENYMSGHASPSTGGSLDYENTDLNSQSYGFDPISENSGFFGEPENASTTNSMNIPYNVPTPGPAPSLVDISQESYLPEHVPVSGPCPGPGPGPGGYPPHPDNGHACECCSSQSISAKSGQVNTWRIANDILSSRFQWPAYFQLLQDNFRDDAPVRAVLEGWDVIEAMGPMHPTWSVMKKIDQTILRRCQPKERMAILYTIQLLLLSHTTPEPPEDLPEFYQKRPSQSMADSYAIHFFPWPGMRERFVFNQHRYCTNDFWNMFLDNLRLIWPFEFRDCYTRNLETGRYAISVLFKERVNDLKCWAMGPDVFKKWPELLNDIPVYNSIPQAVSNLIVNPRLSRGTRTVVSRMDRPSRQRTVPIPVQNGQPTQTMQQPSRLAASPYHSQTMMYTVNRKMMPILSLAENTTQPSASNPNDYNHVPRHLNTTQSW